MAKEKSGYGGYKAFGDSVDGRKAARARLDRAEKNAMERGTNEIFALQDQPFKTACEAAGVPATARQASKYRNDYGAAARAAGKNRRKNPRA